MPLTSLPVEGVRGELEGPKQRKVGADRSARRRGSRQPLPDLDDKFAHRDQAGTADVPHPSARELEHRDLVDFPRQVEPLEHLGHEFPAALELCGEARLPLRVGKGVERALDVEEVTACGMYGDHVQFPFEAAEWPRPDGNRNPDEVASVLEPFGNELFKVVGQQLTVRLGRVVRRIRIKFETEIPNLSQINC